MPSTLTSPPPASAISPEELSALYDQTLGNFTEGSIVEGVVRDVRPNEVLVDIGYKSEGVIPLHEFNHPEDLKVGDTVEVLLDRLEDEEGMVNLSRRRAELQRNWDRVLAVCEEGGTVEGVIRSRVKGGMIVDIGGVDAFLPGSQIDLMPVRNPDDFVDKTFEFRVLKINSDRRNIVVSRRELLEELRREQKKQLLKEIAVGQVRQGRVKNITDFGAFVDLNGMDGLLHITDMSWGRISHPSELVEVGDEIEVVILDIDHEKERISLGMKQKGQDPWENVLEKFPVGTRIRGKVVNVAPYGAFVELERGIEGLVHVSEFSWTKRYAKASDMLTTGDEVEAVVLGVNKEERKISLGIRQTEINPWELVQNHYPVGSRIKGKVRNFTNYGAFVELPEGVDGMIHVSDLSWTKKVAHPSEVLEKGQEVEAVVLEVDPNAQRISLGLKQAQDDPWASIAGRYTVGQKVTGTVSKLANFGAFVELEEGIEGLVHISQISDQRVEKVKDVLTPGQTVEARVIKIDPVERRIGLSIKAASTPDEEFKVEDSMLEGLRSGDDLVDLAGAFEDAFGGSEEEWHPGES